MDSSVTEVKEIGTSSLPVGTGGKSSTQGQRWFSNENVSSKSNMFGLLATPPRMLELRSSKIFEKSSGLIVFQRSAFCPRVSPGTKTYYFNS